MESTGEKGIEKWRNSGCGEGDAASESAAVFDMDPDRRRITWSPDYRGWTTASGRSTDIWLADHSFDAGRFPAKMDAAQKNAGTEKIPDQRHLRTACGSSDSDFVVVDHMENVKLLRFEDIPNQYVKNITNPLTILKIGV